MKSLLILCVKQIKSFMGGHIHQIMFFRNKVKLYSKHVRFLGNSFADTNCIFEGYNSIGEDSKLKSVELGLGSYIGAYNKWTKVKVGKFSSIASNIHIIAGKHPTSTFVSTHPAFFSKSSNAAGFTFVSKQLYDEVPLTKNGFLVEIGSDVWIGDNVSIMSGVTIGDGAIIGANTLVIKDIDPFSINVGIPAKKIKTRFSESEIKKISSLKWWNFDWDWLKTNSEKFSNVKNII